MFFQRVSKIGHESLDRLGNEGIYFMTLYNDWYIGRRERHLQMGEKITFSRSKYSCVFRYLSRVQVLVMCVTEVEMSV